MDFVSRSNNENVILALRYMTSKSVMKIILIVHALELKYFYGN